MLSKKIFLPNIEQEKAFTIPKGFRLVHITTETLSGSGTFSLEFKGTPIFTEQALLEEKKLQSLFINDAPFSMSEDKRGIVKIQGTAKVNVYLLAFPLL